MAYGFACLGGASKSRKALAASALQQDQAMSAYATRHDKLAASPHQSAFGYALISPQPNRS
jgi:hypothetical protein